MGLEWGYNVLGLDLGGLGTKGLGPGLDNIILNLFLVRDALKKPS